MIFTTNKSLKAWGRVLHDEDLAQAIIDRVLERGRVLRLDGPSVRTLHVNLDEAMKEESDQQAEVARISGTHTTRAIDCFSMSPSLNSHARVSRSGSDQPSPIQRFGGLEINDSGLVSPNC